jgi:hypothetical protein
MYTRTVFIIDHISVLGMYLFTGTIGKAGANGYTASNSMNYCLRCLNSKAKLRLPEVGHPCLPDRQGSVLKDVNS